VQISGGVDTDLLIDEVVQRIRPPIWRVAELPPEVGAAALDESTMEMVDAMYLMLTQHDAVAA
jgi:hypothetical protein